MSSLLKKVQKAREKRTSKVGEADELGTSNASIEDQPPSSEDAANFLGGPVALEGKIWKRRGGMGQQTWEQRYFELRGMVLLYYEDDNQQSNATPRGFMDFEKERATVNASTGHQANAPSPFCLSIQVYHETKWKLAFEDQSTLMKWLSALTNAVVQRSANVYNVQLLQSIDPTKQNDKNRIRLRRPRAVYEPTSVPSEQPSEQNHHQLWLTEDYTIRCRNNLVDNDDVASAKNDEDTNATELLEQKHQSELEQRQAAYEKLIQVLQEQIVELTAASTEAQEQHKQEIKDLQQQIARISKDDSDNDSFTSCEEEES